MSRQSKELNRLEAYLTKEMARTGEVAKNCANWKDGHCEACGVQWQNCEVSADFKCPHFRQR